MRRIDAGERRRRLAVRHHLAPNAHVASPVEFARDLVAIHATDPTSVYVGSLARTPGLTVPAMEKLLYDDRSLLRVLGMRRTMFATTLELAGIVNAAVTRTIAARERRRLLDMLAAAGIAKQPARWLAKVEADTVRALEARGEATATELTRDVPALANQIPFGEGRKWAGKFGVSTRVLFLLSAEARIIRGRPRGTWISSQYRWVPMSRWVPGGLPAWQAEAAQAELVRRWLAAFGPGTVVDIQWWTGMTLGLVRKALAALKPVEVDLDGEPGLVLPGDLDRTPDPGPWVALLPGLDTTVMGWKSRAWYLGTHGPVLFDTAGNAGPTMWANGRIVGGWAQRADGQVALEFLEDPGRAARVALEDAAGRLSEWLPDRPVVPRFRTPTEQHLSA